MSQWVSVRLSKEETVHINIANIVKISSTLGQTILHYVNGDRECCPGSRPRNSWRWSTARCRNRPLIKVIFSPALAGRGTLV